MMRGLWICLVLTALLSACGPGPDNPVTPAVDQLTFIFFYTDG